MKVKRFIAVLALALVWIAFHSNSAHSAETMKLKFGHTHVLLHPNHRTAVSFATKVAKYTDGKISVEVYPSSQLGGERDLLEGLRLGTVQVYLGSTAVATQFVPEFDVFQLPYLIKDFPHAERIWNQFLERHIAAKSEKAGFKVLGIYDAGERGLASSKPITKLEDLKGMRIRTMESKISIESYKALGAIATPIPFPDLIGALSQGVVDGSDYAIQTYLQNKVYQVAPLFVRIQIARFPGILAIPQDLWKKLPGESKEAVQRAANEALNEATQLLEDFIKQYEKEAKESKFPFAYGYPDLTGFREAVKPVYTKFEKDVGKETIERVLAIK